MLRSFCSLLILTGILFFSSCAGKRFATQQFNSKTINHHKVAILPAYVVYTGNLPKNMTPEMKAQMEQAESQAIQNSLLNNIMFKERKKHGYRVAFQPTETTIQLLKDNNISIEDSWTKSPDELCRILGVDAVVREKVQKNRFMSDLASYGIQVADDIINIITSGAGLPGYGYPFPNPGASRNPVASGKTYTIQSSCSIMDASNSVLWTRTEYRSCDWNYPPEQAINSLQLRYANKFPYGNKDFRR